VLVLIADHDGGCSVCSGEHLLIFFRNEAHFRGPIQRAQGHVDLLPRGATQLVTQAAEADPSARPRCERGVGVPDAVFDVLRRRLVAVGPNTSARLRSARRRYRSKEPSTVYSVFAGPVDRGGASVGGDVTA
jgi:hypothetical protein